MHEAVRITRFLTMLVTLLVAGCDRPDLNAIQNLADELSAKHLKLAEVRRQAAGTRALLQSNAEVVDDLNGRLAAALKERSEVAEATKRLETEADEWVEQFHQTMRKKSGGMEFDNLSVAQVNYRNVKLQPISGPVVTFSHTGGIAHVLYSELPPHLHEMFGSVEQVAGTAAAFLDVDDFDLAHQLPERPANWNVDYRKLKQDNDRAMRFFAKQQRLQSQRNRCPFR